MSWHQVPALDKQFARENSLQSYHLSVMLHEASMLLGSTFCLMAGTSEYNVTRFLSAQSFMPAATASAMEKSRRVTVIYHIG